MRRKQKLAIWGTVILCIAAACLMYTRPRTIQQRYPYLNLSACSEISGFFYAAPDADDTEFHIRADDARFSELLELIQTAKLKTRLTNLLPQGTKIHRLSDGDFKWELMLYLDPVSFPNGDTGRGYILHFSNFFGDLSFSFDGKQTRFAVKDQAQWLERVKILISQE